MNIGYLVESSKGLQNLSVEDSLTALMAMHLAENSTFKKDEYISEVQELKTKLLDSINSAIEKHQPEGFVMLDIAEGIKSIEQKIDYHLNALSAQKPAMSDFIYVVRRYEDYEGVVDEAFFKNDKDAEAKIKEYVFHVCGLLATYISIDLSKLDNDDVTEIELHENCYVEKYELR